MDKEVLNKIKSAKFPDTPEGKILADSVQKIGEITDDFTKPQNVSTTKIDLTEKVEKAGFTVKQFEDVFGNIKHSEEDSVLYIAAQCAAQPENTDKAKKLKLAKAKMKMAAARLKLMNF